jgi:lactoylglutathione lyase
MSTGAIAFGDCRYKVSDLSAAKAFYSKAFGVQPYFEEPTWIIFQIHDYQLWLEPDNLSGESVYESANPFSELSKHKMLTFWAVDDVNAICNRFKELSGTIFKTPKKEGPFTHAIVIDHWSNKVGLHSSSF